MAKIKGEEITVEKVPVTTEDEAAPSLDLVPYFDSEKSTVTFQGNYERVETYLKKRKEEVLSTKLSAKDLDRVVALKKEAVAYRTSITATLTAGKKKYFNDPKSIYTGKGDTLLAIAGEIEAAADKILDKEEKKRVDALSKVFDLYKDSFQETYDISEEGLASIEYKQTYYNKTAKEKESKDDLELQFKTIKTREDARKSGKAIIERLCAKDPRINQAHFIELLDSGTDVALIMDKIDEEMTRLKDLDSVKTVAVEDAPEGTEFPESTGQVLSDGDKEKIIIGVMGAASRFIQSDFPGKTKSMQVEIIYPIDMGDVLTEVFAQLALKGVKCKVVGAVP